MAHSESMQHRGKLIERGYVRHVLAPLQSARPFPRLGDVKSHEPYKPCFRKHTCTYCYKQFNNENIFQAHFQVHMGLSSATTLNSSMHGNSTRKFACRFCGQAFGTSSNMRLHEITLHDPTRSLDCNFCGCRFENKNFLEYHISRKHLNADFTCEICKKKFTRESTLKTHLFKAHRDPAISSVSCGGCGKSFSSSVFLRLHQGGCAAVACGWCLETFPLPCDLRKHVATTHRQRLECDICGKQFVSKSGLCIHRFTQHSTHSD